MDRAIATTRRVSFDLQTQQKIYERWAPIYDQIYAKLLADAHKRTAEAVSENALSILEIGVGTGLMLPYYPAGKDIYGIDLSRAMLGKAAQKIRRNKLSDVKMLAAMDACALGFPDNSFDAVAIPFVLTLVPDPERALDEAARVLKPGGQMVITTRFGAEEGPQAKVEEFLAPLVKKIGWSTAFKIARVRKWAALRGDMVVDTPQRTFPGGYFKMIRVRKQG